MRIGIGITTTPERELILADTLKMFDTYIKDISNYKPEYVTDVIIYNDKALKGVAYSKNQCLKHLYERKCDHIFLFDDDTIPRVEDFYLPYINHPEPHLMYQFKLPGKPETDMQELYRDEQTVAYSHTRGAMIYVTKEVLDTVGGMDTRYVNGFEHPDWTNRIHNAGLTTYRAMDVPNSHELFYCLDQDGKIESSIPEDKAQHIRNYTLYRKQKNSKEYMEFR